MSEDRRETIVWDNIPEWALYALEYGMDEDLFITDEDREMVTGFITENFPKGYVMSTADESGIQKVQRGRDNRPLSIYAVECAWKCRHILYAHGTACRGGLCRRDCRNKTRHRGRIQGTAG